jgi:hypothetical protein
MHTICNTAFAGVAIALTLGAALMFAPSYSAHVVACLAFVVAGTWAGAAGFMEFRYTRRWTPVRILGAFGVAAFVFGAMPQ